MYKSYLKDIIVITNRKLCDDYETQIKKLCEMGVGAIVVREKDLSIEEYRDVYSRTKAICNQYNISCRVHNFYDVYIEDKDENLPEIHLPLHILREHAEEIISRYKVIGVSTHSVEDVKEAMKLGATYVTVGHIFDTDCKKGLPGRGVDFLKEVCMSTTIPVYAIGGMSMSEECVNEMKSCGAKGICVMSEAMTI